MKSQEEALAKRKADYEKTIKDANSALHTKMVNLENQMRKQLNDKISESFGPNPRQAAVGKAIKDFYDNKTSKAAEKIDQKAKKEEAKVKAEEKKIDAKAEKAADKAADKKTDKATDKKASDKAAEKKAAEKAADKKLEKAADKAAEKAD